MLIYFVTMPEEVARSCSIKKVFSATLQNSEENTCARVSFLKKLQATILKKRHWQIFFSVNFEKLLRAPPIFQNASGPLLL